MKYMEENAMKIKVHRFIGRIVAVFLVICMFIINMAMK